MASKSDAPEPKASGDEARAARTYSGARGNRPQDLPPAARFRRETKEDAARRPNSSPELDEERERIETRKREATEREAKELQEAIRKANA